MQSHYAYTFNEHDIRHFLKANGYTIQNRVGDGGFALVYEVTCDQYNEHFAAKIFPRKGIEHRSTKAFQTEINALKQIFDPHIIYCYKILQSEKYFAIIMEYCPNGSLYDYMSNKGIFKEEIAIPLFHQLLSIINTCHKHNLAHLDIKPHNILIDKHGRLKLSDFGMAGFYNNSSSCFVYGGSLLFMSPEILEKIPYDPFKADIWALGVTFYIMLYGHKPYCVDDKYKLLSNFRNGKFLEERPITPAYQLIKSMLTVDFAKRPTAEELLKNPIFQANVHHLPIGAPFVRHSISSLTPLSSLIVRPKCQAIKQCVSDHAIYSRLRVLPNLM